jgi:pimeloyl-ACP methyl ester carboxylesterase
MGRLGRAAGRLIALAAVAALAACATPAERFERRASALGFTPILLHGDGFDHHSYAAQAGAAGTTLHVYIEHDGTPWASVDGVAADPTPRTPYALELMAKDSGPRLLLGRPCYFQAQTRPPCSPLAWTHRRYSSEVVASMVAALRRYLSEHSFRHVVLVGYSGGGTLAWLIAARMNETIGLVTIAANLDIDDWARLHGYSPLAGSLNPAAALPLSPAIAERHYVGGRDANVPPSVVRAFARRHPRASVIEIAEFDHTCCWLERWPMP